MRLPASVEDATAPPTKGSGELVSKSRPILLSSHLWALPPPQAAHTAAVLARKGRTDCAFGAPVLASSVRLRLPPSPKGKASALRREGGTLGSAQTRQGAAATRGRMKRGAVRHMMHILRMHDAEHLRRSMMRVLRTHEARKSKSHKETTSSRSFISEATSSDKVDIISEATSLGRRPSSFSGFSRCPPCTLHGFFSAKL